MGRVVDAVDRGQQRTSVLGFPIAVIYKYSDDQGNYLAAIITYYAFIAIFPLLLLGSSILGFVLQGNDSLRESVLDSALSQFPIIGDQLGRPEGLQGSAAGLVVGSLVALYGALGLGTAIQNALNTAWAVPRNKRPNPVLLRLRSLMLLATAGVALLAISLASALSQATVFGEQIASYRWPIVLLTVAVMTAVLSLLMQLGVAGTHQLRHAWPGALVIAVLWQTLQVIGTAYVTGILAETSEMNQTFALVLGLIGLLWIAAVMGMIGIEVNVVLSRRLWPRALMAAFSDKSPLTDADRRAYTSYARAQRHKRAQDIKVTFDQSSPLTEPMRLPFDDPED
ncbi:YihY/virulence factor BrkB family protein [Nocardioides pantholopis]|uniref:YihY/virulence factor BrkB family protein n=1 Tax=Nocardioides pantholopis TaxID=2483798 RepID=UPI000F09391D|nr:YihY/virulence factor BrkB family protein [Nocardioides pantholopis]